MTPYITADFFLDRFVRLRYKMSNDGTQIFIVGHDDRRPQIGARSPGFSRFCGRAAKRENSALARDGKRFSLGEVVAARSAGVRAVLKVDPETGANFLAAEVTKRIGLAGKIRLVTSPATTS